jgi:hypothetical protein
LTAVGRATRILAQGQRHAVGGRGPDQRRAAHDHVGYGPGRVGQAGQPDNLDSMR